MLETDKLKTNCSRKKCQNIVNILQFCLLFAKLFFFTANSYVEGFFDKNIPCRFEFTISNAHGFYIVNAPVNFFLVLDLYFHEMDTFDCDIDAVSISVKTIQSMGFNSAYHTKVILGQCMNPTRKKHPLLLINVVVGCVVNISFP